MSSQRPLAPLLFAAAIVAAGMGFALFNIQKQAEHRKLASQGVHAEGIVEQVIESHKSCNSNVVVSWEDATGSSWRETFQTCIAHHRPGETIAVSYLPSSPGTVMLGSGESPYSNDVLRRGAWIGAFVTALGAWLAIRAIRRRASP